MFRYKVDILTQLSQAGYSTYRLRKDKIIGERTIQQIRNGEMVSWKTMDAICTMLGCQLGDLIDHTTKAEEE